MTKSSASRRERRLKQKRGRPSGTFAPLLEDRERFSIAAWLLFDPVLGSHRAAYFATVLIEEAAPFEIGTVEGLLSTASANYRPPPGTLADLDDRARTLAAKAKKICSRASKRELDWLNFSSGALQALITFAVMGDAKGIGRALKMLRQAGWGEILARVERRLDSKTEPFDQDRLRAAGRRLLEALRKRNALKT